jgi:hypothetical protein
MYILISYAFIQLAGQTLLSINSRPVSGSELEDGTDAVEYLADEKNFPLRYLLVFEF